MLFFLISCFSFILFSMSTSLKPLLPLKSDWRLLSPVWFWEEVCSFIVSWLQTGRLALSFYQLSLIMPLKKINHGAKVESVEEERVTSLLDLPDLAFECILERLSPAELCSMAGVCISLRDKCRSDHLWEKHMKRKWGRLIGGAAYREWQWHLASTKRPTFLGQNKQKGLVGFVQSILTLSWIRPKLECENEPRNSLPVDSVMALYFSLESGKFWFPAQVYNRENGNVGFMLSCYDAKLSYDSQTDTFQARYSPHGRRMIEENIRWDRIRAPAVATPPNVLHISDCLNDLNPGDHVEIQWRRSKEFPYGWWYCVVGHMESCSRNENYCHCQYNDAVILEFNQYTLGSKWRRTAISRKDHREIGDEAGGFYGGIRKLYRDDEISFWKRLWPAQVLE